MTIDDIETQLIGLCQVAFNKFPKDRYQPSYKLERLDKKEIRPGSMQVDFPCVKVMVTVPGNPKKQCYILYRSNEEGLYKDYYNGRTGRQSVLDSEKLEEVNTFKLASDLATFIEYVVAPLRVLSIGGV